MVSKSSPRFSPLLSAFETILPLWRSDIDVTRLVELSWRSAARCNLTSRQVLILYLNSSPWVFTSWSCFLMKSLIPRIRTSVFQLSFCFQLRVFEGFGGLRRLEVGDGYLVVGLLCFVLEVTLGPFWVDFLFCQNSTWPTDSCPSYRRKDINPGSDDCI